MKIHLLTPALAALLAFALVNAPVTTSAQTTNTAASTAPAKAKTNKINYNGALTAVDSTGNTVTVDSKSKKEGEKTLMLTINAATKITRDKKPATLAEFAVGEKVTGSYVVETSGTMTAVKLTFTTMKAKTPKKAPAAPAGEASPAPASGGTAPTTAPATQ